MNKRPLSSLYVITFIMALTLISIPGFAALQLLHITSNLETVTLDGQVFDKYLIHVAADESSNMAFAWDGSFLGPIRQVQPQSIKTPTRDAFTASPSDEAADSHFMFYQGTKLNMNNPATYGFANQLITLRALDETACQSDGYLKGVFGLRPLNSTLPNQPGAAMNLTFAQILVPAGGIVSMVGAFADGNGIKTPVNIPDISILAVQELTFAKVPEPSLLALISIGGLTLHRFRKRKSI